MKYLLLLAVAVGCSGSTQPAESPLSGPPGCDEVKYAQLISAEAAQLILACSQFESLDDCPTATKKPIQDAFKKEFDKWGACTDPQEEQQ